MKFLFTFRGSCDPTDMANRERLVEAINKDEATKRFRVQFPNADLVKVETLDQATKRILAKPF